MKIKEKDYYIAIANLAVWELIIFLSAVLPSDKYSGGADRGVFITMAEFLAVFAVPVIIGMSGHRRTYRIAAGIVTAVLIFGSMNSLLFGAVMYLNGGIEMNLRLIVIAVLNIVFIFSGIYWFLNITETRKK